MGRYRHPVLGWEADLTTERFDRWAQAFGRMRENGVDVEFVVDHSNKAEDVRGYVTSIYRDGDSLYADVDVKADDQDAVDLVRRCRNVSVWVEPAVKDGQGHDYGEALLHVSAVQAPVVPGQRPFEAIAAGMAALRAGPVLVLSTTNQGAGTMKLEDLQTIMGDAGKDLTDENAAEKLGEFVQGLQAKPTTLQAELDQAKARIEELEKAGATKDPEIDPDALDMMAESAGERLDALVASNKITPAVRDRLGKVLVGEVGKPNAMMLSRRASGAAGSVAKLVIDALKENDVVKLGEQTASQAMAMSRQSPGGEPDADPEVTKSMTEMANAGISSD